MTDAESAQVALYWVCGLRLKEIARRYGKRTAPPICSAIAAFIIKYHPTPPIRVDGGLRHYWGRKSFEVPPLKPGGIMLYEWRPVADPICWKDDPAAEYPGIDRKVLAAEAISAWVLRQPVKPRLRVLAVTG